MNKEYLADRAKQIMEEEVFDLFLNEMKQDLALKIIQSHPEQKAEREEWYLLSTAVNVLKAKLQEYANEFDLSQENE